MDYEIQYKKGAENKVVDALSRREELAATISTTSVWIKEVEESYVADELIQKLISECVIRGKNSEGIEYRNGLVYKNGKIYIGANNDVRKKIIREIYGTQHGDILESKQVMRAKMHFYWLGMKE